MDQGSFLGLRALGHQPWTFFTWVYDRPVDLDALRRFNEGLAGTLLGRLVQRSPLPGGRHRWVAVDAVPPLEIESVPRSRDAIQDWTDELGDRGVDPEQGPGWRIGVLPLTDGGTAVAMVSPHALGDGLCKLDAITDAVTGVRRRPAYPVRGARPRRVVLGSDLVTFVHEVPAVLRAVVAAVGVARAKAGAKAAAPVTARVAATVPAVRRAAPFHASAACVRVAQADWDAVAARLGGTSNTLVSAFAARLGGRFGRVDADGRVTLAVPVSVRTEDDTRANALDSVLVHADPDELARDLPGLRAATKAALRERAEQPNAMLAVLPLVPVTPAAVVRRAEHVAMGSASAPIGCSNHGRLDRAIMRIDGADPDDFWARSAEPGQTAAELDRLGGKLYVLSGRALDAVYLSVVAHPVGGGLTREHLNQHVTTTLHDFGLTAATVTR
jgi:diacylglycerol O-acyltransferase